MVTPVNVNRLAGNELRVVGGEDGDGHSHIRDVDEMPYGRALGGALEQVIEVIDTGSSARLDRPWRDRMYPNSLGPELVGLRFDLSQYCNLR